MASRKNKRRRVDVVVLKAGYCFEGVNAEPGDTVKVFAKTVNWLDYNDIAVTPKHYGEDKEYYDEVVAEAKEERKRELEQMQLHSFDPFAPENQPAAAPKPKGKGRGKGKGKGKAKPAEQEAEPTAEDAADDDGGLVDDLDGIDGDAAEDAAEDGQQADA